MSKLNKLMNECRSRNYNCSITLQRINLYSVEIYRGYQTTYQQAFYSDGHATSKQAIKKGLKFINRIPLHQHFKNK